MRVGHSKVEELIVRLKDGLHKGEMNKYVNKL